MSLQIVDNETVTEPITLAEARAYLQVDADYAADDNDIDLNLVAARKRLEAYLNIGLAKRAIQVYWNGTPIELPLSPTGDILSVKKNTDDLTTDDYTVVLYPAKQIAVNSASDFSGNWFYSMNNSYVEYTPSSPNSFTDVYVCEYETGYETLPGDLKQALLAETHYLFHLRGAPITDLISPNAVLLASSYSRNLIL